MHFASTRRYKPDVSGGLDTSRFAKYAESMEDSMPVLSKKDNRLWDQARPAKSRYARIEYFFCTFVRACQSVPRRPLRRSATRGEAATPDRTRGNACVRGGLARRARGDLASRRDTFSGQGGSPFFLTFAQ